MSHVDQSSLNIVSKFLVKNSLNEILVVQVHLMAGDILHALDVLVKIAEKDGILGLSNSNSSANSVANLSKNSDCVVVSPRRLKSAINLTKTIEKGNFIITFLIF